MRALFWLLTLAALAIGATMLGRLSDGYVLWVMPPWRAEVSFNLFVVLQLLALVVAYLLLRLIFNTLKLPKVVTAISRTARTAAQRACRHRGLAQFLGRSLQPCAQERGKRCDRESQHWRDGSPQC